MRQQPFPLVGGSYLDESRPYSLQDTVNMRPQRAGKEGARAPSKLQTLPGLRPDVAVPGSGNVRGLHNAEGRLLAPMGSTLYRISNSGVAIPLGALPGSGRVQMAHNQISLGNEVLAVNGSAGYLWNSVTDEYGRVTDDGFPAGSVVKFVDGYFVVIDKQGRYAASSRPAQGTVWNTLDRWTSEVSPDPLTAAGVRGSELLLLSTTSGEFFQATANAQQPFRTKKISFRNAGAPGPHGVVEADGNIFWLGWDGFYALNGYSPRVVSHRAINEEIKARDLTRAFGFLWDTVVYWTFPDGLTWGYDFAEDEWHRRQSYGMDRWRVNAMARMGSDWIAGDFQHRRLWTCQRSDRYWLEGDTEYVVRRTLAVIHDHQNRVGVPRLELVMDTGQEPTTAIDFPAQPEPPTITGTPTSGYVDRAYSFQFTLDDGTPPYRVTLREGTLPEGLTLSSGGLLSGTPTTEGDTEITLRVRDANDLWSEHTATVPILPVYDYIALLHLAEDNVDEMGAAWSGGVPEATPTLYGGGSIRINGHASNIITDEDYVTAIGSDPFTIGMRVYRDSAGIGHVSDILLGHWYSSGTRSFNWASLRADGLLRLFLSSDGTAFTEIVSTDELPYDEWVWCEAARDEDDVVHLSINGVPNGSATFAGPLHTNELLGLNWIIGGNDSTAGADPVQGLEGWVREFAIIRGCLRVPPFTPPTAPWPDPPPP